MSFSAADFHYIRTLVQSRAAIVMEEEKAYLAESRLTPLARREGFGSVSELVRRLRAAPAHALQQRVVEAMTTNETSFFRDMRPFDAFRRDILPELLERRAAERSLEIWSGACSTGQEPYSLAMLLDDGVPELKRWRVRIVATDLSTHTLARAVQGRYSQMEVNRGLPARYLVKYFRREGIDWQLVDEIRSMVEFKPLNLIEPWPLAQSLDVVLLRNVLIYFDVPTRQEILRKVRRVLRPDGYLFLGGAETTFNLDPGFERINIERSCGFRLSRP